MNGGFNLHHASVRYGSHKALEDVSLDIQSGDQVALVGPSGAGKTTFLRLLNGSARVDAGQVIVDGRDLATMGSGDLRKLRSSIGVVYQDLRLVPNLRVSQNVLAGGFGRQGLWSSARAMWRPHQADLERAHAILERVGIGEKLFHRVDRLSGGQQQRVAIARALYQDPRVLLADEPVASVDPARAQDTVGLLVELARERGLTLVMSLHDLTLARMFFSRLVGLRDGRVQFDGVPDDLASSAFQDLYRLPGGEAVDDHT